MYIKHDVDAEVAYPELFVWKRVVRTQSKQRKQNNQFIFYPKNPKSALNLF